MDEQNESPKIKTLREKQEALQQQFNAAASDPVFLKVCANLRQADSNYRNAKTAADLARNVTSLPKFNPPLNNHGVPQLPKPEEPSLFGRLFNFLLPGENNPKQLPEEVAESKARNSYNLAREEFNKFRDELRKKAFALVCAQDALLRETGQSADSQADSVRLNQLALVMLVQLPVLKGLDEYVLPR